jgi:monooxygenase
MVPFGRIDLHVDGEKVDLNDRLLHKAAMVSDVPNFAFVVGYTNQAWTLKSDLVSDYVCRLLAHMDRHGYTTVTPVADDAALIRRPFIELQTGYVSRAMHRFPKQRLARSVDG